jgi:hypothetical protein
MNRLFQRWSVYCGLAILPLVVFCTTDQYSTTVITEEEVALQGQVVNEKGEGQAGIVATLAHIGFSDTTDARGMYVISIKAGEFVRALFKDSTGFDIDLENLNLKTLLPPSQDSLLILRNDSVLATLKFTQWQANLPTVVIRNRNIICRFDRPSEGILWGEAAIFINQDDSLMYHKTVEIWHDTSEKYLSGNTDFIYQDIAISSYAVYVNLFDKAGRFVGRTYTKTNIPVSAGQLEFTDINPFNALPIASAGNDTTVSINDTVRLIGKATDDFEGTIIRHEWNIGADPFFTWDPTRSDHQYRFRAPKTATPNLQCILRVTDNDSNQVCDTMVVKVVTGAPKVSASTATPTVSIKDSIMLHAVALDEYGAIVSWEWNFGSRDSFVTMPFDSIFKTIAPDTACDSFFCIVRVTDDDSMQALDTVTINVKWDRPWVSAVAAVPRVSINDSIACSLSAGDSMGRIVAWEVRARSDNGFTNIANPSAFKIKAPATPADTYAIIVRVTDDDGLTALDTVSVSVVLDSPTVTAMASNAQVSINDTIELNALAKDGLGSIDALAWRIGSDTSYSTVPAGVPYKIKAPAVSTDSLKCIVRAIDDDGLTAFDTVIVSVTLNPPTVTALTSSRIVSINDSITLNAIATDPMGAVTAWAWRIGNDTAFTSVSTGPLFHSKAPAVPITALLCIIRVTDDDGLQAFDSVTVDVVLDHPTVTAFTTTPKVAVGGTILLKANGQDRFGSIVQWEWMVGNGACMSSSQGTLSVMAPLVPTDTFVCIARVTDDDGLYGLDTVFITVVREPPSVVVSTTTPKVAINDTAVFNATTNFTMGTIVRWEWDVGNSGTFVPAPINKAFKARVPQTPADLFECVIRITDEDGLQARDTIGVEVLLNPPVVLASTTTPRVTINDTLQLSAAAFDSMGTIVKVEWDVGNTDAFIPVTANRVYKVKAPVTPDDFFDCIVRVTDDDGLSAKDTVTVAVVLDPPRVIASTPLAKVAINDTIVLNATSSDSMGTIVKWEWDVGNTAVFTTTPVHRAYKIKAPASPQDYYECVIRVTDDDNLTALDTVVIAVAYEPPIVKATTTTPEVTINDTLLLNAAITATVGKIVKWEWDIGNTGTFAPVAPNRVYKARAPGQPAEFFDCVIRVTDDDGLQSYDTVSVTVLLGQPRVTAAAAASVVSINDTIALSATALDSLGKIVQWEWDVGATGAFTTVPLNRVYKVTAPATPRGGYDCIIRVTDDDANQAFDTVTIAVELGAPTVIAATTTPRISINDTMHLSAAIGHTLGTIVSREWDIGNHGTFVPVLGDGAFKAIAPPVAEKSYPCVIRVTDDDANVAFDTVGIEVLLDPPVVTLTTPTPIVSINDTIVCNAKAIDSLGRIIGWEWDAGNTGVFTTTPTATFRTVAPSNQQPAYLCVVRVTDDDGNTALDTVTIDVQLFSPMVTAYTATARVSINDQVTLKATASDKNGAIVKQEWDVGNTQTFVAAGFDGSLTISVPATPTGAYLCIARVTDDDGLIALDTVVIEVILDPPTVTAHTTTPMVSINDSIFLDATANDNNGAIVKREWDIGNTGTFIQTALSGVYKSVAPSSPTNALNCVVRVTDDDGNVALNTVSIEVLLDAPLTTAGTTTPQVSINDQIVFTATASDKYGRIVKWEWDVGATGAFIETTPRSAITARAPAESVEEYTGIVRVTDDDDNIELDTVMIRVAQDAPRVAMHTSTPAIYPYDQLSLSATATDTFGTIVKWEWDPGNTGWFTTTTDSIFSTWAYVGSGTYDCVVRVTDDDGLMGLDTISIAIINAPLVPDANGHPMVSSTIEQSILDSIANKGYAVIQSDWMGTVLLAREPSASGAAPKRRHFSLNGEYFPQVFEQSLNQWRDLEAQKGAVTSFDLAFISANIKIVALNNMNTRVVNDIDGDGYDDRFAIFNGHASIWRGSWNGKPVYTGNYTIENGYDYGNITEYRWGHFTSTYRTDLLHVIPGNPTLDIWIAQGDGAFTLDRYTPVGSPDENAGTGFILTGNFDANGYTDIVHIRDSKWSSVWQNNGSGNPRNLFSITPQWFPWGNSDLFFSMTPSDYAVADFDGDGRDDINHFFGTRGSIVWFGDLDEWYKFSPHNFDYPDDYIGGLGKEFIIADINNDHMADMIQLPPYLSTSEVWQATGIRPVQAFTYVGRF